MKRLGSHDGVCFWDDETASAAKQVRGLALLFGWTAGVHSICRKCRVAMFGSLRSEFVYTAMVAERRGAESSEQRGGAGRGEAKNEQHKVVMSNDVMCVSLCASLLNCRVDVVTPEQILEYLRALPNNPECVLRCPS